MSKIRQRFHKAVDEQRRLRPSRPVGPGAEQVAEAFRPVRQAAEELRDELRRLPGLALTIAPDSIWVDFYDKHLWFSYDLEKRRFVGSELDTLWMEGGQREEHHEWATADACIDAMIQALARYASLAEAAARFQPKT